MDRFTLPRLRVQGSRRAMGLAHGEALRTLIQGFVAQRLEAFRVFSAERGQHFDVSRFIALGGECLEALARFHPAGHAEHVAVAEGADVEAAALYAVGNMTDVRDVLLWGDPSVAPAPAADVEGCTAALIPSAGARENVLIAGQTWDLNPEDLPYVVAIHRVPEDGPEVWTVSCAGCLSLTGMNEFGLTVGTTNIKTRGGRVGIGYLSVLHRMLEERDVAAAESALRSTPRAGAHTYWAADENGAFEAETTPDRIVLRRLGERPLGRSNHCLDPRIAELEAEAATSSSKARLARVEGELAARPQDVHTLRELFGSRADGVDSISRHIEDGQGTSTNSVLIGVPARRELHACRGPAELAEWVTLAFERGTP